MPGVIASQLIGKVGLEGFEKTKSDLETIGKKTDEAKAHFKGLKDALSTAAGFAIFGGVTAGIGFMKDQVTDIIKVTEQYQLTQQQTNQVLKSTHDVSGMTKASLEDLAQAYGKTTMFSADTVQGGENLLLTFTNIGKQVFPDATKAILDVSQAMGQDLKSSAIQVGKALGDPTTGMTALQRIGVTFSATEKEQIKTMMAHNDIIGAQKIILHELATEFGGSAQAAGKTFAGQMQILSNTFDEIKIKIGSALLPVLSDLMNKYVVPLVQHFQDWMLKGGGLNDFQTWIKQAVGLFESQLLPDLNILLNQAIIPLATATYDLFIKSGFLQGVFQTLQGIFQTVVPQIGNFVKFLQDGSGPAQVVTAAMAGFALAIGGIKIAGIISDIGKMGKAALDFVANDGAKLLNFFSPTDPSGFAMKSTASSAIVEGDMAAVGTSADNAAGDVAMIGSSAEADAIEVTGAMSGIGGAFASIGGFLATAAGWLSDIAGTLLSLPGPILGIIAGFMTVPGVLQSIPKGDYWWDHLQQPGTGKSAPGYHGVRGRAAGEMNISGGSYLVGERGPELVNLPSGANIIPNNQIGSYGGGGNGGGQQINLQLDGTTFARLFLPYLADALRYNVPIYGA